MTSLGVRIKACRHSLNDAASILLTPKENKPNYWRWCFDVSYDSQKVAAQGNEAIMDDGSPRNFEIYAAFEVKSEPFDEAWILVLIESAGNKTASIDMPAKPPAIIEANAAFFEMVVSVYA